MVDKDNGEFLAVHEEVVKKVLETLRMRKSYMT